MPTFVLFAAADVRHRVESRLLEACDAWWHLPALVVAVVAVAAVAIWISRRDAVETRPATAVLLTGLRLAALAGVAAAVCDVERIAEHEIVLPSRVAVVVDTSASMSLAAAPGDDLSRCRRAAALLDADGVVAALRRRHEVDIWRFGADVEPVVRLPVSAAGAEADGGWTERLAAEGVETRLAEAVARPLTDGPSGTLAGIMVLSDGGANAGGDPATAAEAARAAGVAVHAVGIGADRLPDDVRVADLIVPARVFPGDRFPVTAFLRSQGFAGRTVRVELLEGAADADADAAVLDAVDVVLAADGELVPVRFDVPGIRATGRRTLGVRLTSPAERGGVVERRAELEVVDRVTRVLLMAGGPGREYQFLRNVLARDRSFSVDVLLGTAAPGSSQDARRVLEAFPATDEALGDYDAVAAIDVDWRAVDPAGQARLERWVARESGGLVLVAGPVFTQSWLDDPRSSVIRDLAPVEVRRSATLGPADRDQASPQPLVFTREGREAEFLWLAASRGASDAIWREFPGVHACFPVDGPKAGATEYLELGRTAGLDGPLFLAGQYYGAGVVAWVGSGELWRLRSVDPAAHERLVTQLLRHVSQGRLLRGARRAQLIVDRDRCPVGGEVIVRVVAAAGDEIARPAAARVVAPNGVTTPLRLEPEAARPGTLRGSFVAAREGGWLVEVDAVAGDERLARRIEAHLPERELARPLLERGTLAHLATTTGGTVRFLADADWTDGDTAALVAACPDRTRREYETGGTDAAFKRRLNAGLLAGVAGCLGLEWLIRRLARMA